MCTPTNQPAIIMTVSCAQVEKCVSFILSARVNNTLTCVNSVYDLFAQTPYTAAQYDELCTVVCIRGVMVHYTTLAAGVPVDIA